MRVCQAHRILTFFALLQALLVAGGVIVSKVLDPFEPNFPSSDPVFNYPYVMSIAPWEDFLSNTCHGSFHNPRC